MFFKKNKSFKQELSSVCQQTIEARVVNVEQRLNDLFLQITALANYQGLIINKKWNENPYEIKEKIGNSLGNVGSVTTTMCGSSTCSK